ncbi:MAG: peptidoglycan DD-metalloendopeptidase family protein [Patescibacteria group bacterium]
MLSSFTFADTASDIQAKISAKNDEIKKLEEEIKQYQNSLDQTAGQAKTLQNELKQLTLSKQKLQTELKSTEANLTKTSAVITEISGEINKTENSISGKKNEIAFTLRDLRSTESTSFMEELLSNENLSSLSDYLENSIKLSDSLKEVIIGLQSDEENLSSKKAEQQGKQTVLKKLKTDLSGQQKAVVDTAKQKDTLLAVTKNQESNYQKILSDKITLRAQFEKEIFDYESQLNISIDRNLLPTGSSLTWPLDKIFVTQQFGKTSTSGRLYASGTHNGIDLRASEGTPVHAALSGTVTATGNTDLKASCYSYGKWILIKHPNGLSTLYAHLSSVSVAAGQGVATGDTIAYSGHTGYATGPHLHLTVFATQGVQVMIYPPEKAINCGGVTIPIADPKAFLDPLLYLPAIKI